jgi:hypothetical protein
MTVHSPSSHFKEFSGLLGSSWTTPFKRAPFLGQSGGPAKELFPFIGSFLQYIPVQPLGCCIRKVCVDILRTVLVTGLELTEWMPIRVEKMLTADKEKKSKPPVNAFENIATGMHDKLRPNVLGTNRRHRISFLFLKRITASM